MDSLGAVLHGLTQLRAGWASTKDLATTILMSSGLLNRLEGIRDMGVTRATAQYRRDALVKKDPSAMEQWATGS
ncbi:hypothetical protein ACFCZT_42215 [Streptomyces sp. NPDC056230]|uniref:hypothetical protein n=1 Tax=unclassified Streptomyces TaxID=2593676 RepID=UPI0035DECFA9